jgi:peptide/nickel transport system substrate-binding protein
MHKKITRRNFLIVSASGAAGLVLAACSPTSSPTTPPVDSTTAPVDTQPNEAAPATAGEKSARGFVEPPFLADRIKAGKLPPIDERLPQDVFVVDLTF